MVKINDILCVPKSDKKKRFLIGEKGSRELLAIGVNPSSANEYKLDPTSKNIKAIAKKYNCDGWWIINLYPIKTSKPKDLPKRINHMLASQNLDMIYSIIANDNYNFKKILCCWGNHISTRYYLRPQANKITSMLQQIDAKIYCLGLTALGNPIHPSPLAINTIFKGIKNVDLKNFN
ncbi:MAG: hypothetical protein CMC83_05555 [Flavobacteriaceae bacterium]|nr:hypothetical protein [Flavobacteriaceae bacterium]|tara:strand:- start:1077 stop:1607 length:531 start_codon:yes stop_codon:yes gene_type:complete